MPEFEKTIAFVVDGEVAATISEGKLQLPPALPLTVVHLERRVEEAKFDSVGGYQDNGPPSSMSG